MRGFRVPLVAIVVACAACDRTHLTTTAGNIDVSPSALAFGDVALATTKSLAVTLHNESLSPQTGHLSAPAPFALERDVTVGGGTSIDVEVVFAPAQVAPAAATLTFTLGSDAVELALTGNGTPAWVCAPPIDCHTCDGVVQADGTACLSANACLTGGTCHQGVCLGVTRSCDDANACTSDFCDSSGGCSHVDTSSQCPAPTDLCAAPLCDPVKGCTSAPVVDGTSCGPNDCVTAHVCLSGQCKAMAVPEGFACSGANPCQGAGVCHNGSCALPLAEPLTEAWRYTPTGVSSFYFDGVTDSAGNLYWLECVFTGFGGSSGGRTSCNLVSYTSGGTPRFSVPHSGSEGPPIRQMVVGDMFVSASLPHNVQASSLDTGALLWSIDVTLGPEISNVPADAQLSSLVSDGVGLRGFLVSGSSMTVPVQAVAVNLMGTASLSTVYAGGGSTLVLDLLGDAYADLGPDTDPRLVGTTATGSSLFAAADTTGQPVSTCANEILLWSGAVRSTADGSFISAQPASWFPMPSGPSLMSSTARWQVGSTSGCTWCRECDCAGPITPITLRSYSSGSASPTFETYIADLRLPTAPVLLSSSSVLVASRKTTDAATYLRAIDAQGHEAFACALPEPAPVSGNWTEYSGSVSLADGKWAVVHRDHCGNCVRDPDPYIEVFSVAGLTEAASGWTGEWGGSGRRGQAH